MEEQQTSETEANKNKLIYGGLIAVGLIVIGVLSYYFLFRSDTKPNNNNNQPATTNLDPNNKPTIRTQSDRDEVIKKIQKDFLSKVKNKDDDSSFTSFDEFKQVFDHDILKIKLETKDRDSINKEIKAELDEIDKELPELKKKYDQEKKNHKKKLAEIDNNKKEHYTKKLQELKKVKGEKQDKKLIAHNELFVAYLNAKEASAESPDDEQLKKDLENAKNNLVNEAYKKAKKDYKDILQKSKNFLNMIKLTIESIPQE